MTGLLYIMAALVIALIYGAAQAIGDLRNGRYMWAVAGAIAVIASGVALTVRIPTHAVKLDLPQ